jgi:ketosteroid isomerase-like protein
MIRRADAASIAKVLADDYIVTDEVGTRLTKEQDLATYKDRAASVKIDVVEYKDQTVRMITKDVAVEHSTIRFAGDRSGKPFDFIERITTTWARRNGRWQIVADHFSYLKE